MRFEIQTSKKRATISFSGSKKQLWLCIVSPNGDNKMLAVSASEADSSPDYRGVIIERDPWRALAISTIKEPPHFPSLPPSVIGYTKWGPSVA